MRPNAKSLNTIIMKKIFLISAAAAMLFAACGNNNQNNNQQSQNEPVVEEPIMEEPVVEEPAAPEFETYDHYEWQMTLPVKGWEVDNAYSEMGINCLDEKAHLNVKDWKNTSLEKCIPNGGCLEKNRQADIVIGDITWKVYTKTSWYGVACYTFNPDFNNMVVRVGIEGIEDPADPRLMKVLEGFAFKPVE